MNWRPVRSQGYSPPPTYNRRAATPDRICLPPQELDSVYWVPRCNSHPNTLPVPPQLVTMRPGQRIPGTVTIPNDFHHSDCDSVATYLLSRYPETNDPQNLRPPGTNDPAAQTENRSDPSTPPNQNLPSGAQTHHPASRSNEQPGSAPQEVTCTDSPQIASQHQQSSSHGEIQQSLDLSDSNLSLVQQTDATQADDAHQFAAIPSTGVPPGHSAEFTSPPCKVQQLQDPISAHQTRKLIHRRSSSCDEIQQPLDLSGKKDPSALSAQSSSLDRHRHVPQGGAPKLAANTPLSASTTPTDLTSPLQKIQRAPVPISAPPTREGIHGKSSLLGENEQLLKLSSREQDTSAFSAGSTGRYSLLVRPGDIPQADAADQVAAIPSTSVPSKHSTELTSPPRCCCCWIFLNWCFRPSCLLRQDYDEVPTSASKTCKVIHGQSSSLDKSEQLLELPGREQDTSASPERDSSSVRQGEFPQDDAHQVAANTPAGVSSGCSTESTSPLPKIQQPQNPENPPEPMRRENPLSDRDNTSDQQQFSGTRKAIAGLITDNHGGPINLNLINSPVTVIAKSEATDVNADKPSNTSSTSSKENEDKFLEFCKNVTEENTKHDVRSTFESTLSTPTTEINPVYLRTEYYRGDIDLDLQKYHPDDLYKHHSRREKKGERVKIEQLLDKGKFVALIGDAGAGKTTTAKRLAQMVNSSGIPSLRYIKLVLFIKFAELDSSREYDVFNLIFVETLGTKLTPKLKEYGREWVRENSEKILLVMDGLDQADWKFGEEKDRKTMSYDEKATAPRIFYNVLKNKDFLGCKSLITCREHAIEHCSKDMRPNDIIALTGLEPKDRDDLIRQMAGDKYEEILNHLRNTSPGLLSLCQTPMFLVFTTAVLLCDLKNAPETMSGILFRILVHFQYSKNNSKKGAEVLLKGLKHLAFNGIKEKKVIFKATELSDYDLDLRQVQDLVLVVPQSVAQNFYVIKTKFQNIFFCHQLIQETFAALYICEMAPDKFKDFIWNNFDSSHFSVVRAIVLGILLNPNVDAGISESILGDISEKGQKVKALKDWLETIFNNRVKEKVQRDKNILNLASAKDHVWFKLLYECGDGTNDILKKHLHSVNITKRNFEGDILHMVMSVMSRCSAISQAKFKLMTLRNGDVDKLVGALAPCNSLKVGTMQLDKINNQEAKQLLEALDRTKKKTCVEMDNREPDIQIDVQELELLHNECIDYQDVVGLLQVCQVVTLKILDCVMKRHQNEERVNTFDEAKINLNTLRLRENKHLDYKLVADLLQVCQFLEILNLSDSNITPQQMEDLIGELGKAKINLKVLALNGNKHLDFKLVAQLLQVCQVSDTLRLTNCDIKSQQIEEFIQGFGKANINLNGLNLSFNEHLDYKLLPQLLQVCQVSEMLGLSGCEIKSHQIEELIQGLSEAKFNIVELNLHGNEDLDYNSVGKLTRVLGVERLGLSFCQATSQNVDELIEGHGDATINLKIKDLFRAHGEYLSPANFKNEIERQLKRQAGLEK